MPKQSTRGKEFLEMLNDPEFIKEQEELQAKHKSVIFGALKELFDYGKTLAEDKGYTEDHIQIGEKIIKAVKKLQSQYGIRSLVDPAEAQAEQIQLSNERQKILDNDFLKEEE